MTERKSCTMATHQNLNDGDGWSTSDSSAADNIAINCPKCSSCKPSRSPKMKRSNGVKTSESKSGEPCSGCQCHSRKRDSKGHCLPSDSCHASEKNGEVSVSCHNGTGNSDKENNDVKCLQNGNQHSSSTPISSKHSRDFPSTPVTDRPSSSCSGAAKTPAADTSTLATDMSSASFFSIPDDGLASPGSESMVTACEGGSSRSCSSLSCPSSSGSSASSLVCALSPDRDSVVTNHDSPAGHTDEAIESLADNFHNNLSTDTAVENTADMNGQQQQISSSVTGIIDVPSPNSTCTVTAQNSSLVDVSADTSLAVCMNNLSLGTPEPKSEHVQYSAYNR